MFSIVRLKAISENEADGGDSLTPCAGSRSGEEILEEKAEMLDMFRSRSCPTFHAGRHW